LNPDGVSSYLKPLACRNAMLKCSNSLIFCIHKKDEFCGATTTTIIP